MIRRLIGCMKLTTGLLLLLTSIRPATAVDIQLNGHAFHLPDGFTIDLVARTPLVDRPIGAAFDEQGRLYVTDSSGSNEPLEVQLKKKPHRVVRLEDTNGDGRFDKSIVFADRMMFPEGAMWLKGSLYVSAPPSIWKLTDTDGDGKADRREEWFQGKTVTHCGNDLHGPYLGPDGYIYWCKGAFATQTYQRPGKQAFVTGAAHIFRCRPDAPRDPKTGSVLTSAIEPVMTGGMDNPVDVTFTLGGERVFTTTFLVNPGGGLRDGLIHAIYGGVYGKQQRAIDGHPRTGELMPILRHLGAAAPCGLTTYRSSVFGPDFKGNLFACLFNMHKVTRHALRKTGATFKTVNHDFLVSDNLDFHPTDVLEDADGSLIVIDTGGWYKLCCPTSQLSKPDILGAIYRVRRTGRPPVRDPRGLALKWPTLKPTELVGLLGDPRPAVRDRAVETLSRHAAEAVTALKQTVRHSGRAEARRNAVWALTRIDGAAARAVVRAALSDADETVRQAAIHSVSVHRDRKAAAWLVVLLRSSSAHNRRAAAEALGRIGESHTVPALLSAAGEPHDRVLEHSLIYALIEIADRAATRAGLSASNTRTHRAALIALDQMPSGDPKHSDVVPLLSSTDPVLRKTAAWIVDNHSEWGGSLVSHFRDQLGRQRLSKSQQAGLQQRLARFASDPAVQKLLAVSLRGDRLADDSRAVVLKAMARSKLKQLPPNWIPGLIGMLQANSRTLVRDAVGVLRTLRPPRRGTDSLRAALLAVGQRQQVPSELRLEALAAIPGGLKHVSSELFGLLTRSLDPDLPVATRAAAVDVLSRARLDVSQQVALAARFKNISPLDVDNLLKAFQRFSDERVGLALVAALEESTARSALHVKTLKPRFAKFPRTVQQRAGKLYQLIRADTAAQTARLEHLLTSLPTGDVRRGQVVFRSAKASCAACHAIGYLGGRAGPDLTRIGRIRNKRDLLEAIVFPSASLVRSFESVVVATSEGKIYNGLIREDTSEVLVLAIGPNKQVRIPRDEVEEMRPSKISIMPAGFDKQITPQQLADLVEFLQSRK